VEGSPCAAAVEEVTGGVVIFSGVVTGRRIISDDLTRVVDLRRNCERVSRVIEGGS
jgi:hypothetical protein